jgi:DNA-binding transcriptional ArsR family regulator
MSQELKVMRNKCHRVAALMKHLSHPQRLLILCFLAEGEKSVTEIHEAVGLSQSQASQFLKRMQLEGVVEMRKEGTFCFYSLLSPQIRDLLKYMKQVF